MPARRIPVQVLPGCRGRVPVGELRRVVSHVLDAEDVARHVEVEIVLADSDTVRTLNRMYRGKDEPTDVLSFDSTANGLGWEDHLGPEAPATYAPAMPEFIEAPDEEPSLGEIVVCLPVAESQAANSGHSIGGEVSHLIVHGLLHLLGYDHEEADESAAMQAREDELLIALGYAGSYEHGDH